MNKVTLLTLLVVVLLIVNGISLYMLFKKHGGRRDGAPNPRMLFAKLQLDDKQEQQFEELRKVHFKERDLLRAEDVRLRKELAAMISKEVTDSLKLDSLTSMLAANRKQFELGIYNHFRQLQLLLKPEQKPKFEQIMNEIIMRQSQGDRRSPGKPPPHQP